MQKRQPAGRAHSEDVNMVNSAEERPQQQYSAH